ncbi:MAG: hypothetical protein ACHQNE_07610 [Candidatus Kapaibacterium sp.]
MNVRIDKLTRSIQLRISGDRFDTIIQRLWPADSDLLKGGAWQFDWERELHQKNREVYTLTTILNPTIIQGLISLEDRDDHIFVHLIENADFNKSRQKLFEGVAGNLFAFACKMSFEKGYGGFVAFDWKTVLIPHYEKTLGAKRLSGIRMFLNRESAYKLAAQYFKDFDNNIQNATD